MKEIQETASCLLHEIYSKSCLLYILYNKTNSLLPPASEGWGKVLFSVCLSVHTSTGGTPSQVWVGVLHPRSGWRGTQSQVWMERFPIPGLGVPHPSQVWMVEEVPGVPPARSRWWGVPPPGLDGGVYPGVPPS